MLGKKRARFVARAVVFWRGLVLQGMRATLLCCVVAARALHSGKKKPLPATLKPDEVASAWPTVSHGEGGDLRGKQARRHTLNCHGIIKFQRKRKSM